MALEWGALAAVVVAEAILLLFVTFPGAHRFRKGIIAVAQSALQPLMSVVPFSAFLLLDIYWKYENHPHCEGPTCSLAEREHHAKSIIKSQRNFLLVIFAMFQYYLLYRFTHLIIRIDRLYKQVKDYKDAKEGRDSD